MDVPATRYRYRCQRVPGVLLWLAVSLLALMAVADALRAQGRAPSSKPAAAALSGTRMKPTAATLYGRIQYVDSLPDVRVQVVGALADLDVQIVDSLPDRPGRWQIVQSLPDWRVQIVQANADLRVRFVNALPGPRR